MQKCKNIPNQPDYIDRCRSCNLATCHCQANAEVPNLKLSFTTNPILKQITKNFTILYSTPHLPHRNKTGHYDIGHHLDAKLKFFSKTRRTTHRYLALPDCRASGFPAELLLNFLLRRFVLAPRRLYKSVSPSPCPELFPSPPSKS